MPCCLAFHEIASSANGVFWRRRDSAVGTLQAVYTIGPHEQ